MASNLVENKLSKVVAQIEETRKKNYDWCEKSAKESSNNFYESIQKAKDGKL